MGDFKKQFEDKVIGKMICVHLKDDRKVYGQLICIDKQKNLVINESITEIDSKYNTPINDNLKIYLKFEIEAQKYVKLSQAILEDSAKLEKVNEVFRKNKFWTGNIIIAERHFTKIEITHSG